MNWNLSMKIFIINLKRSQDRKNFMKEQIKKLNSEFEFIFFEAIDSKNNEHLRFKKHFHDLFAIFYSGTKLTESELACYASHFLLWQKCVELNEAIIILEDDVIFDLDFAKNVDLICKSDFECVRLIYTSVGNIKFHKINEYFYITHNDLSGTQGYYINPIGASKFINKSLKYWLKTVDGFIDYSYIHGVPKIVFHKHLLFDTGSKNDKNLNHKFVSTIRHKEIAKWKRLKKNIHRIFKLSIKLRASLYRKKNPINLMPKIQNPYHKCKNIIKSIKN